jgi:hypothetical protein
MLQRRYFSRVIRQEKEMGTSALWKVATTLGWDGLKVVREWCLRQ